jgi:DNA polymerase V
MVLAWVDGGFTVKFLHPHPGGGCLLRAANPDYPDLVVREDDEARVWGVVTHVIHSC